MVIFHCLGIKWNDHRLSKKWWDIGTSVNDTFYGETGNLLSKPLILGFAII